MMALVIEALSWIFILLGSGFIVIGAIGMVRMPDLFTRMQTASLIDTSGAGFLLLGLMLQAGFTLVAVKLLFIAALFFFVGPMGSHALAQAALHEGIKPILAEDRRNRLDSGARSEKSV